MARYTLRRLLLMIPTLFGIMLLNFIIVQAAPGGPIDQMLARFEGADAMASTRLDMGAPTFRSVMIRVEPEVSIRALSNSWNSSLALISLHTSASSA
ncbi:hypothetical protein HSBAA_34300 [Vreelandella sulfidaeris]|uniref:Uncharacterized protein n=1 Tax=Vreelandella sulfidaeris TaxID=115553 RepID=A0A455UGR3_9GAMM|nr:hypothetical protein HSBAA_34300 [Halomonas sulfidaeris]